MQPHRPPYCRSILSQHTLNHCDIPRYIAAVTCRAVAVQWGLSSSDASEQALLALDRGRGHKASCSRGRGGGTGRAGPKAILPHHCCLGGPLACISPRPCRGAHCDQIIAGEDFGLAAGDSDLAMPKAHHMAGIQTAGSGDRSKQHNETGENLTQDTLNSHVEALQCASDIWSKLLHPSSPPLCQQMRQCCLKRYHCASGTQKQHCTACRSQLSETV